MGIKETFTVLGTTRSDQIVPTLLTALNQTDPRILAAAATAIMQNKSPIAVHELLKRYDELPKEVADIVAGGIYRLHDNLVEFVRGGAVKIRRTILSLLQNNTSVDTLDLLALYLTEDDPAIRHQVATAIETAVQRFADEKREAEAAIADGFSRATGSVRSIERINSDLMLVKRGMKLGLESIAFHQSPAIVIGCCRIGKEGYELLCDTLKREGGSNSPRDAIATILKADDSQTALRFVFFLLAHDMGFFRNIGNEILRAKTTRTAMESVLAIIRMMPREEQRHMVRMNQGAPWLHVLGRDINLLPSDYSRFLFKEIERLEIDSWKKLVFFGILAHSPDDETRTGCVEILCRSSHPDARKALADLLDNGREQVQLKVIEALVTSNAADAQKLIAPKVTSEFEAVRELAGRVISKSTFKKYIESFDKLDEHTRQLAGKAFAEFDESMVNQLLDELKHADPAKRLKAVRIIQATAAEGKLGAVLLELVSDPDKKVRATIVQLLAAMRNTDAIKALVKLLSDKDERVQANAVEAVEELRSPKLRSVLVPFLRHPNNRVRGNACKALWTLGVRDILPVVHAMLEDSDPKMRMSAAWVLREIRSEGALDRIRAALAKEQDKGVKERMQKAETFLAAASNIRETS